MKSIHQADIIFYGGFPNFNNNFESLTKGKKIKFMTDKYVSQKFTLYISTTNY